MVSQDVVAFFGGCAILVVVVLPFLWLFHNVSKEQEANDEEAAAGGGEDTGQFPAAAEASQQDSGAPLVCTYRRADGWREGSCGVCLSELADGEVVRVLPACMHYFHAACVGEWLVAHATCPLCRAPLAAAATP